MFCRKLAYSTVWQRVVGLPGITFETVMNMSLEAAQNISSVTVPVSGSVARVGYMDLGSRDGPVCLGVHGAPGAVDDMSDFAEPFTQAGFRLVVPEFPGYGNTELEDEGAFDESTEARVELLQNFLSAIKVTRVVAVMGHSMGSVAALHLAANTDICQSVILLSGLGMSPHRALRPHWLVCLFAWMLSNSFTQSPASRLLISSYNSRGFNITSDFGLRTGILSVARLDFKQVCADVESVRAKRLPLLTAVTQNDQLVEWTLPVSLAKHCGATDSHITYLDADELIVCGPDLDDASVGYPRVLVFARGGHWVHRSHLHIVSQAVIRVLQHVSAS